MVVIVLLMECLQLEEVGCWDAGRGQAFLCLVQCWGVVGVASHSDTVNICKASEHVVVCNMTC